MSDLINYKIFNILNLNKIYGDTEHVINPSDLHINFRFDLVIPVILVYINNISKNLEQLQEINLELYKKDHNPARLKNYYYADITIDNYRSHTALLFENLKIKIKYKDIVKEYLKTNDFTISIQNVIYKEFDILVNKKLLEVRSHKLKTAKNKNINELIYDRFFILTKQKFDSMFSNDLEYSYIQDSLSDISGDNFGFSNIISSKYFDIDLTVRLKKIDNVFCLIFLKLIIDSKSAYKITVGLDTIDKKFNKFYNLNYDNIEFIDELSGFINSIQIKLLEKHNNSLSELESIKQKLIQIRQEKQNLENSKIKINDEYVLELKNIQERYQEALTNIDNKSDELSRIEWQLKQKINDTLILSIV